MKLHLELSTSSLFVTALTIAFTTFASFTSFEASASPGSATAPASVAKTKVVFSTSSLPEGQMSPFAYGIEKGFYAEEGIDLVMQEGKGSQATAKNVAEGNVRFASVDSNAAAKLIAEGGSIKAIASMFSTTPYCIAFFAEKGYKSVKDLKGKKIGIAKGSGTAVLMPAFFEANGLSMNDIIPVEIDNKNRHELLKNGSVDAAGWIVMNSKSLQLETGKPIAALQYASYGLPVPGEVLVVNTTNIEKPEDKDLTCRFIRATKKSWQESEKNPKEAVAAMHKLFPKTDSGQVEASIFALTKGIELNQAKKSLKKPFGTIFAQDWQRLLDVQKKYKIVPETKPLDQYYTNEFVDCADKK